jgi:hypothetical protein
MLSLPDADVPPPAQKFGLPVLNLTQEQKRAARQHMSSQGGRNPYADFYQPNPYALRPDGPAIYHPSYYFEGPPAQLPHFRINVFDITIIDILKEGESSSVFKVSINAKLRVLKLVSNSLWRLHHRFLLTLPLRHRNHSSIRVILIKPRHSSVATVSRGNALRTGLYEPLVYVLKASYPPVKDGLS